MSEITSQWWLIEAGYILIGGDKEDLDSDGLPWGDLEYADGISFWRVDNSLEVWNGTKRT